jgi:hypothetical protein
MDDPQYTDLRKLVGQHQKLVYEAVKAGMVTELSPENQHSAKAIQEHMHLKHVHNALEFADLREGEPYEVTVEGTTVNPLAHVNGHAAVKGQIEQDPLVKAAFDKMVATGTSAHHAEHVLSAMLLELVWESSQGAATVEDGEKARLRYYRKLKKIAGDSAYRKKLTRQFAPDHHAFE